MFNAVFHASRYSILRASLRALHSTPIAAKTATEKVSEVADKVNKTLGKGLASAIETGEQATQATKETLGSTTDQVKDKARRASNAVEKNVGHASDVAGEQKDHASNVAGQKMKQAEASARDVKDQFEKQVKK